MLKKKLVLILCIFCALLSVDIKAQNNDTNWQIGVSLSSVYFADKDNGTKVGDRFNAQFPSIQLSKGLGKQLYADFIYTTGASSYLGIDNQFRYSSFDTYLRYNFGEIFSNGIPFVGVGIGYIKGSSLVANPQDVVGVNIMVGGTLWLSDRLGLTGRVVNKLVDSGYTSMANNLNGTLGVVYSFNIRSKTKEGRKRLWGK